jgi:hypothetical protein
VFGTLVSAEITQAFREICEVFKFMPFVSVGYHGTSEESWIKIRSSSLLPTFGQLGTGIYVGSFWKACRFAVRDQAYKFRKSPVVMRLLWHSVSIQPFPWLPCKCELCKEKPEEKAAVCAHETVWKDSAGCLTPLQYSAGKWATQNEEWVIAPKCLLHQSLAVKIDTHSVEKSHYDPLQRNILII